MIFVLFPVNPNNSSKQSFFLLFADLLSSSLVVSPSLSRGFAYFVSCTPSVSLFSCVAPLCHAIPGIWGALQLSFPMASTLLICAFLCHLAWVVCLRWLRYCPGIPFEFLIRIAPAPNSTNSQWSCVSGQMLPRIMPRRRNVGLQAAENANYGKYLHSSTVIADYASEHCRLGGLEDQGVRLMANGGQNAPAECHQAARHRSSLLGDRLGLLTCLLIITHSLAKLAGN